MRSYIQRWSVIKNSAENVFDERAIDTFINGLRRQDFIEELGRSNRKTVSVLMDIANRFADGEDSFHNKRTRSPEDDQSQRYNSQRRRSQNYDGYNGPSQVAVVSEATTTRETNIVPVGTAMKTEMHQVLRPPSLKRSKIPSFESLL
jgi:hypothetical protein